MLPKARHIDELQINDLDSFILYKLNDLFSCHVLNLPLSILVSGATQRLSFNLFEILNIERIYQTAGESILVVDGIRSTLIENGPVRHIMPVLPARNQVFRNNALEGGGEFVKALPRSSVEPIVVIEVFISARE